MHGLYAITKVIANNEERLFEDVAAVIRGGAGFVQYRDKIHSAPARQRIGHRLLMLCRELGAKLIINDDIVLCRLIDADGVHLGREDDDLARARMSLGDSKIIGVSCYNQLQLALQAQQNGADYIAFGSFFHSSTKPHAMHAPLSLLNEARTPLTVPVVAIGGITADNGQRLVNAGADALAVINGVFAEDDIEAAARKLSQIFIK